jgi:hypothetical protein
MERDNVTIPLKNGNNSAATGKILISNKIRYIVFAAFSLFFIIFGMFHNSPLEIVDGIYKIIIEPDVLITDYIAIGGMGAAFVNAGILMLISIAMLFYQRAEMNGLSIAAISLMGGFGLFGKNIFNIWLIILGVFLYSRFSKEGFRKYIYTALFGTCLAPIISEIFFGLDITLWSKIILGTFVGVSIGFILPIVSAHLFHIHKGFNLYNIGFTAGIIGSVYVSVFRSYGFVSYSKLIWSEGNNMLLGITFGVLFVTMMMIGYLFNGKSLRNFMNILKYSGTSGCDFVELEGFGITLIQMGINGLLSLGYVLLVRGDLNGPTLGGIITVMGFGAYGKHARNIIPIYLGVLLGGVTKIWRINDPHSLLAALFGTGLAPIAGHYGWIYGIIAGFINSSMVLNSGILHGGMNLYNTGFSAGIVAGVMVPILDAIKKVKSRE